MPSNARLILGLISLALINKAACDQILFFCSGLVGPARDCSPLIPGFCESAGNTPLPPGNQIQNCIQETAPGGETGDLRFSCDISVENMAATAEIPSVQLCEEVLLAINNTCEEANGGQAQAMGDSFAYNYHYRPGGCA
ncbi:hypothetical protein MVEN_01640900 [Mycena venus]|uniref:Glycan binding protein Y3-like domain-containing protein n=1 Tax=Mycena venus TaxID=2733690 RepID=A0A8H6XNY0_9AGAR|nr:hypothetical protein MVEN_01640900 [Mycena venus]